MQDDQRRFAPATARNRDPILDVLRRVLPPVGTVLEVASGTGEHVVYFARRMPGLVWQPTDVNPSALASIEAWRAHEALPDVRPTERLDVTAEPWAVEGPYDAVFNANMIHISPWACCLGLMRGVGAVLRAGGVLVMYGPYRIGGEHTSESNARFDEDLRSRDPSWGVRDLEAVIERADAAGLQFRERIAMPANNFSLVFDRR